MTLPAVFKNDIESKQTSIITRVIIGDNLMHLSTHSITFENQYYKPLLLNLPYLNESVDYEKRNFKTASVTLKISNYKYQEEIFSDILKSNPLINEEVNIYFDTQSATSSEDSLLVFKGYVARINHNNSEVNIILEDLTQSKMSKNIPSVKTSTSESVPSKYRNKIIPIVYGHLKGAPAIIDSGNTLKADSDNSVSLVSSTVDEYLNIGTSENYEPDTIFESFDDWGAKGISPVMVYIDDFMAHVPIKTLESLKDIEIATFNSLDYTQWTSYDSDSPGQVKLVPEKQADLGAAGIHKTLQLIVPFKSKNISCYLRENLSNVSSQNDLSDSYQFGWDSQMNLFEDAMNQAISDNDYTPTSLLNFNNSEPYSYWNEIDYQNYGHLYLYFAHYVNQSLIKISIDSDLGIDYSALSDNLQMSINSFLFPKMPSTLSQSDNSKLYIISHDGNGFIATGATALATNDNVSSMHLGSQFNQVFTDSNIDTSPKDLFLFFNHFGESEYSGLNVEGDNQIIFETSANINPDSVVYGNLGEAEWNTFRHETSYVIIEQNSLTIDIMLGMNIFINPNDIYDDIPLDLYAKVRGQINEVDLLTCCNVKYKPDKLNFFLNVNGRVENGVVLRNPIEIMRNIAITELGLDESQIDEDSYNKAKEIHFNYKFDFSVNKEIEGKKLLEDIARSTLCYPYFDNKGKLNFPSMKTLYTQVDDYDNTDNAITIKEDDVINYSFSRTKNEHCYSRIEFNYNYNYASKAYDSKLESGLYPEPNELFYNSHVDFDGTPDVDYNVLTFESKYIKDDATADLVWKRMFRFYKHQHLLCKIKLPLKYVNINPGQIIKFDKLIQGIKAFGIDYTKVIQLAESQNAGSIFYPLFFVTSARKNLDFVEIEGIQLNTLDAIDINTWDEKLLDFDYNTGDTSFEDTIVEGEGTGNHYGDQGLYYDDYVENPPSVVLENLIYGGKRFSEGAADENAEFFLFSEENIIIDDIVSWSPNLYDRTFYVPSGAFYGHPVHENLIVQIMYSHTNVGWGVNYDADGTCYYGLVTESNHNGPFEFIGHNIFKIMIYNTPIHNMESFNAQFISTGQIPQPEYWRLPTLGVNGLAEFFLGLTPRQPIPGNLQLDPHTVFGQQLNWANALKGDVNFDGMLNILDITAFIALILGNNSFTSPAQAYLADYNLDQSFNAMDIVSLVQHIMNQ
ncbi:MAG: hypothetical protein Unbinned2990contig1002_10 [Prokaryotic dsDNA virus sp.]|nr:MAG: hypothetical protein Unbinned2990contig1002_10 [Prokaryotic dsDNA virus sp.]|tara:strand:- start:2669 stop:6235 length:3567 start_codon:yes stop_codon:yes gene_type:complete